MTAPELKTGIERYGVCVNPFIRGPLDPLSASDPTEVPRPIGGLESLAAVEQYMQRAVAANEPVFVLVSGTRKSGRTSICNHLLAMYRDARKEIADPAKFVVPRRDEVGRNPQILFKKWIRMLHQDLRSEGLTPLQDGRIDLEADIASGAQLNDADTWEETAEFWMRETAKMLGSARQAGFGVCLENVESAEVLASALAIFKRTRTIVVMTVLTDTDGTSVRRHFRQRTPAGNAVAATQYPVVDLLNVAGPDAGTLVRYRWNAVVGDEVESPFDEDGLASAFGQPARPTGRVLYLTAKMFDEKAAALDAGPPWPDAKDELAFEAAWMANRVRWLDDNLPE
jgi:hypothetical protein